MKECKTAILVILCIASTAAHGISLSCMVDYIEGGAPGVFISPECQQWVSVAEFHQNLSTKCQFATLQGLREYQEDGLICNLNLRVPFQGKNGPLDVSIGVAAVFDGHGGKEASEMASKVFLDYFLLHIVFCKYTQEFSFKEDQKFGYQHVHNYHEEQLLNTNNRSFLGAIPLIDQASLHFILKEALLRTIHDIDSKFLMEALDENYISGTTATIVLLLNGQFLVASVGDSKALLCSEGIKPQMNYKGTLRRKLYPLELTTDHHPDRPDERARIEANGGTVRLRGVPRVNGVLALSRAIGDVPLKRYGVIASPEVMDWQVLNTTDHYLVIASDGIFESLSLQMVCDLLNDACDGRNQKPKSTSHNSSLAECVANTAFEKGSEDNLTVIVIPLRV